MVTMTVTQENLKINIKVVVIESGKEKKKIMKKGKERRKILYFCAVINMIVGNTIFKFKKRPSHIVNYESDPSKTCVDYCLVGSKNGKKDSF